MFAIVHYYNDAKEPQNRIVFENTAELLTYVRGLIYTFDAYLSSMDEIGQLTDSLSAQYDYEKWLRDTEKIANEIAQKIQLASLTHNDIYESKTYYHFESAIYDVLLEITYLPERS